MTEWERFTLVFEGDLRSFKDNIFHADSTFGKPCAAGTGDAFARQDEAEAIANDLFDALADLMAVMPPNGRTREQMDAMVKAGKALARGRDL